MAKNSVKKALLRLPEPLWKSLKRTAKKENRSMHGQILEILQEYQTQSKPTVPTVSVVEINQVQEQREKIGLALETV